jgi:transcriptional regulator with XRE-family HTH domain
MSHDAESDTPTRTVARRVKELRTRHGWSAAQLAERMAESGLPWDRFTVANLERGRRQNVTLDEVLTLAYVLDVAPVHLVVPTSGSAGYLVTPKFITTPDVARTWIRGQMPLGDPRIYYSEAPEDEWIPPGPQLAKGTDDG